MSATDRLTIEIPRAERKTFGSEGRCCVCSHKKGEHLVEMDNVNLHMCSECCECAIYLCKTGDCARDSYPEPVTEHSYMKAPTKSAVCVECIATDAWGAIGVCSRHPKVPFVDGRMLCEWHMALALKALVEKHLDIRVVTP
jgi:hypothetical protein